MFAIMEPNISLIFCLSSRYVKSKLSCESRHKKSRFKVVNCGLSWGYFTKMWRFGRFAQPVCISIYLYISLCVFLCSSQIYKEIGSNFSCSHFSEPVTSCHFSPLFKEHLTLNSLVCSSVWALSLPDNRQSWAVTLSLVNVRKSLCSSLCYVLRKMF